MGRFEKSVNPKRAPWNGHSPHRTSSQQHKQSERCTRVSLQLTLLVTFHILLQPYRSLSSPVRTMQTLVLDRVCTLFQKQISRLFQDSDWFFKGSKIHSNPYTPKIPLLIFLTACHTLHIFALSLTDFQNFQDQWPFSRVFQSWKMPE